MDVHQRYLVGTPKEALAANAHLNALDSDIAVGAELQTQLIVRDEAAKREGVHA